MKTQQAGTPGRCSDDPLVLTFCLHGSLLWLDETGQGKAGKAAHMEPWPGTMQGIAAAHAAPSVGSLSDRGFSSRRKSREKEES